MYGKYRKGGKIRAKKKMSPTRRAYIAGLRKGRAMARSRFRKGRWY